MSILKKINNKHFLALAGNAVVPALGMFIFALLAHKLPTKDEFGNWIFFLTIYNLADTFRTGFLSTSLVKFYSGASKERALNIAGSAWYIGILISVIFCLINLLVYFFYKAADNAAMSNVINWIGITFLFSLPYNVASWILQAEGRFGGLFWIRMINQGLFFLFIIVLILINKLNLLNVIYTNLLSSTITTLFTLISGWDKIRSIAYKTKESVNEMFNFGKYSVGTSISSYLLRSSDSFIIKFMLGPAALAVYYLPQRLMEIIEIPLRSFTSTAMPIMSAAVYKNDTQYVIYIMKKYAGVITMALIPVSVIAFVGSDVIIAIIGGNKYLHSEAANIFRIFMCYAMLLPIDRFFGITLDIINKPHLNMVKVMLMLVLNITGDFLSIFIFHSIYGVAIASIVTFFAGTVFGYYALKKHLNFSIVDIFKVGYSESELIINNLVAKLKSNKASN